MHRCVMAVLLLFLGLRSASAELDVQTKDGLLTVRARAVPLVEVLDRLSRETGMKLVYMGGRPAQAITVNIESVSESEAVSRILEGLGLSYIFQMDPSRRRVVTLILHEASRSGALSTPARGPTPARSLGDASSRQAPPERSMPPEEDEDDSSDPGGANPPAAAAVESNVPSPAEVAPRAATPVAPGVVMPAGVAPGLPAPGTPGSAIPAWARGSNPTAQPPGVPPPQLPEDPSSPTPPPQD